MSPRQLPLTMLTVFLCALSFATLPAQELPSGYWGLDRTEPILKKTLFLELAPDLSHLTPPEQAALQKLLEAGKIMHQLYLQQKHVDSIGSLQRLQRLDREMGSPQATQNLLKLYWISKGPIATTLDNQRLPFLPVSDEDKGKAVYPPNVDKSQLDELIAQSPATRQQLLDPRAVVRAATAENLQRHRETLARHAVLARLHGNFSRQLGRMRPGTPAFYAVPHAVEYADSLLAIFELLNAAADDIDAQDGEFAGYLRNRARDLLSSNYESGDASWVTGRFGNLNAQIGSYETYDDALYGVKAFYSMSILARDPAKSASLAKAIQNIQAIEDHLPYEHHKRVRDNIPVHVCNVIADFGQSRGTNTATILPNDAEYSRKYGRTILLRYNIMTHPALFDLAAQRFRTAVAPEFRDDLNLQSTFQRTLWHEVGHYLGVDRTADGRELDEGLQQYADLYEEMKADLVSLFAAHELADADVHTPEQLQTIYAGGVLRVLQLVRPRPEQPYQTMQLIQWNYFLENELLIFDSTTGLLSIDYARYHEVVTNLLTKVLAMQRAGDPLRAGEFVKKYTAWREDLHEVVAARLRAATAYRYRHVTYKAL